MKILVPRSGAENHRSQLFNNPHSRRDENRLVTVDSCPSCGKPMATDQRYCLECGSRRGDPRLPFMDAVVFMEASKQPEAAGAAPPPLPPAGEPKRGISNNTALVAGVATLVLAIGVGVLIGRSGESSSQPVANNQPQVIKVEGGGGGGGGGEEATAAAGSSKAEKSGGASKSKKASKAAKAEEEAIEAGGETGAEEVLKPSADAKPLPPAATEPGDKCEKGTAGCNKSGEFDGSFFE